MLDHMTLANKFVGLKERPGHDVNHPLIMAMLTLDAEWPGNDEVPWCSGYINFVCWLAGLQRTESLLARSWLAVGGPIDLNAAREGDVVIFNRGGSQDPTQPGPGHVAFYLSHDDTFVHVLGGNQSNRVSEGTYPVLNLLGIRRLT